MQNLEDLKEKIFFEAKNILDTLSKITSSEELLLKKDLIEDLNERVSFLRILDKNEDLFSLNVEESNDQNAEESDSKPTLEVVTEREIEEEVIFTNELNEINEDEITEVAPEKEVLNQETEETVTFEEEYQKNLAEKEKELNDLEERRRTIVEFEKEQPEPKLVESIQPEELSTIQKQHQEEAKKFKLANIKGLKTIEPLFDDDPLEKIQETKSEKIQETEVLEDKGSILKSNIPTDFMEAEKPKPEFRLDINDRIAFTKTLFDGSQTELNATINQLNAFKTIEEAKEFLSEEYYNRKWDKHEEFAQRLWSLVENKFL